MAQYRNKAPPHLVPPYLTEQGFRIPTERERSLSNQRVSCVYIGESSKGEELVKGEEQFRDNPVVESDQKQPMLIQDLSE